MVDVLNKGQRLMVEAGEKGVPFLTVAVQQIPTITALLQAHQIPHSVWDYHMTVGADPEFTILYLERRADGPRVQALLDRAP
jgi:hypothetical protein